MGSKKNYSFTNTHKIETCILVAVEIPSNKDKTVEYLDELSALANTAGLVVQYRFIQKLQHPHPKTYVGKGKLEEIANYCKDFEIDTLLIDDELSPSQVRNIELVVQNVKVLSRAHIILDIFAKNAQSAQAKLQVELAQSIFMLPRLTGMWTHLSKQKGGVGMKGPGETEIETDRRALRNRISVLKSRLKEIETQSFIQRKNRSTEKRIALVGYTNVGKSTIMNLLSKSDVLAENKLFATLDSTVRKISVFNEKLNTMQSILLSDTVGFIRKLPTTLIESFKSTLAEVQEADILLHVVDISSPYFEEQMVVVRETLHSIGASNKPEIVVFNKIDAFENKQDDFFIGDSGLTLEEFEKSWIQKANAPAVFISASKKENIEKLREYLTLY